MTDAGTRHDGGAVASPDARVFLHRLLRLDPVAQCRVERVGERSALWAVLPWDVLVTRQVDVRLPTGTPAAAQLLAALEAGDAAGPPAAVPADPVTTDPRWRWGLPGGTGEAIERIPAREISRIGEAAARTLRTVADSGLSGRAVGQRAVRDALLDHVPITVASGGQTVGVPQRLVQGVVRMGFLGPSPTADAVVVVRVLPGWVGLAADYGTSWWHRVSRLSLRPVSSGVHRH